MEEIRYKIGDYFFKGGLLLVVLSLVLLFLIFYPLLRSEIKFFFSDKKEDARIVLNSSTPTSEEIGGREIKPVDENFSVIIPKINANEKVVANVNPFDQGEYRKALENGIAHAKGSGLPGTEGNVFLFAHSSENFYRSNQTNSTFFLLNKLENGDHFSVVYTGKIFDYEVFGKKIVADEEVSYLKNKKGEEIVTLMTCWPPGTSYKRLLIFGRRQQ